MMLKRERTLIGRFVIRGNTGNGVTITVSIPYRKVRYEEEVRLIMDSFKFQSLIGRFKNYACHYPNA